MKGCIEYVITDAEREQRRPGITAILTEIRKTHPDWEPALIEAAAKEQWHAEQDLDV